MGNRLDLHEVLCTVLGSRNVYFQSPESMGMDYPCIVYSLSNVHTTYANDTPYSIAKEYEIKVIDSDPDSIIPGKVATLPTSSFKRRYTADNLNHVVYNIYY